MRAVPHPSAALRGDLGVALEIIETRVQAWAARHSLTLLRLSLGFVFVLFGVLKFFPDLSPAQGIAQDTSDKLFLGLFPDRVDLTLVAVLEVAVGVCLLSGRYVRFAVVLLLFEMIGILSPLILLPGALFGGPHHLPNLLGQYILKDVVLLSAVLVLLGAQRGGHLTPGPAAAALDGTGPTPSMTPAVASPAAGARPVRGAGPGDAGGTGAQPSVVRAAAGRSTGPAPPDGSAERRSGPGLLGSPQAVRRDRRLVPSGSPTGAVRGPRPHR